ncbi:MAG: glycosyltransferase [Verrucomicrobiaceae bacterium]
MSRLQVDGKHFLLDGRRHFLKCVTYGPHPDEAGIADGIELGRIREAGLDAVRTYGLPDREFLDLAEQNDLIVLPTHAWGYGCDFFAKPTIFEAARRELVDWLNQFKNHRALGAVFVANEVPSDMARWMHPARVRAKLDELIIAGKKAAPNIPLAYASYPTTEYLEPLRADFTAFNVYLEDPADLAKYLPRLHHLAGDRPVMIAEFGLDTQRHAEAQQAGLLTEALKVCVQAGVVGCALYAWSDHWENGGKTILDWSFGLTRRDGSEKPIVDELRRLRLSFDPPGTPRMSVIICTRNGEERLKACLDAATALEYPDYEVIVVNDGSTDGTRELLEGYPGIRAFHLDPSGLSTARNHGAEMATGEIFAYTDDDCVVDPHWLTELARVYSTTDYAAVGGPNLSPDPGCLSLALTTAAPGAPTHVMLTDTEAEHIPGCNMTVRREAFEMIGGFDPIYHAAGDDVDFCWRLRDAGMAIGFSAAAFVWHHRRTTPWRYFKQQMGYGHAEALLFRKHPDRFGDGGIEWEGAVYQGSALGVQSGDYIYTGPMGDAPYQSLALTRQPERGLPANYDHLTARIGLGLMGKISGQLRVWKRKRSGGPGRPEPWHPEQPRSAPVNATATFIHHEGKGRSDLYNLLLLDGWDPCDECEWDLQKGVARLFAATEQTSQAANRTFVRFHASPSLVSRVKQRAGFGGFLPAKSDSDHILISKTS